MRRIFERLARGTKRVHALFVRQRDRLNQTVFPRIAFQSKLARSSQYRPEIDGLRALAVLPVLFFHTEIPGFSGGFVGVDIFYVISGYLITSVIAKDVAVGRFSFVSFYDRRIRRIFPALFAVVFFSLLAGALLLVPKDFAVFGKSLIAMTFSSAISSLKGQGASRVILATIHTRKYCCILGHYLWRSSFICFFRRC